MNCKISFKKNYALFYLVFLVLFFLSCNLDFQDPPPFCISKPIIILNDENAYESSCGLFFLIKNTSTETIQSIRFQFSAYDSLLNKSITRKVLNELETSIYLEPNEQLELFIDLEPYILIIPENTCIVDYFFIKEIIFTNGARWQDTFAQYAYYNE